MQAINLKTEYLINPLGLDIRNPACSGIVRRQPADCLRIAAVDADGLTAWDSGRVESSSMTHILWAGRPLQAGTGSHGGCACGRKPSGG
jgi:alpha-L-rhamnosidase